MVFSIIGKVALITGGGTGLGLQFAKALLANGAKGVTLADINVDAGEKSAQALNKEFGSDKSIFVKTDTTFYNAFEDSFKKTVEKFGNVDILISNAGIQQDSIWRREVDINVVGYINGILLGMDNYLQKYKSSNEALIVLTSSVCGLEGYPQWPIYSATKFAVTGMLKSWGSDIHYDRTKVRVIGICPGPTNTDLLTSGKQHLNADYAATMKYLEKEISGKQEPEHVASELIKLISTSKTGSMWVVENGQPSYEFILSTREDFRK